MFKILTALRDDKTLNELTLSHKIFKSRANS